eukprot:TRINITY_DN3547_c0_g4_i1.p3 TRINITY_DN3547_c0_g4~~TRINITY_DN3547_c0_g4_i1.p3  ORF type:complete len:217 (-),score=-12.11 TRINITY_DN3547_c0_g4_i1:839-1489(-)
MLLYFNFNAFFLFLYVYLILFTLIYFNLIQYFSSKAQTNNISEKLFIKKQKIGNKLEVQYNAINPTYFKNENKKLFNQKLSKQFYKIQHYQNTCICPHMHAYVQVQVSVNIKNQETQKFLEIYKMSFPTQGYAKISIYIYFIINKLFRQMLHFIYFNYLIIQRLHNYHNCYFYDYLQKTNEKQFSSVSSVRVSNIRKQTKIFIGFLYLQLKPQIIK